MRAGIPMAAGQLRRAPDVMQRLGMEWLQRLALEPRRLARRYLLDDLPFALTLLATAVRRRMTTPRRQICTMATATSPPSPRPRPLAVVVVTYASAGVVADCLTALPAALEGAGPAQIIVVDNASPDDTVDVVADTAPEAEIVRRTGNDGFAAGVNAGLAAAAGCDVLVINRDVRLSPGSVAGLRQALLTPGTGIVVPHLTDAAGRRHHSLRREPTVLRTLGEAVLGGTTAGHLPALGELVLDPARYQRPGTTDWAVGAAWLVSRDCVDAIGVLDERYFLYSEETEYMLRANDHGFSVRYEPTAGATHLGGAQASSPWLWALSAVNRVRLHRERRGEAAAVLMWLAVLLGEILRLVAHGRGDRDRHRAAVTALLRMRRWPAGLTAADLGYSRRVF